MIVAFSLLNMNPETTNRVVENLQVCSYCYTTSKFIYDIVARKIAFTYVNHFHHFKHGKCSHGDY